MQCLIGLLLDACLLGVIYAKFANPSNRSASILFTRNAVISTRDGVRCFVFRVANMRRHTLMSAVFKVFYITEAKTIEGESYLKFNEMKVNNDELVFFSGYPFTVIHKIDEQSPLYRFEKIPDDGEIIVLLEACDTSTSNNMQARYSYTSSEILNDEYFANIVTRAENGTLQVDYGKFHATGTIEELYPETIKSDNSMEVSRLDIRKNIDVNPKGEDDT